MRRGRPAGRKRFRRDFTIGMDTISILNQLKKNGITASSAIDNGVKIYWNELKRRKL